MHNTQDCIHEFISNQTWNLYKNMLPTSIINQDTRRFLFGTDRSPSFRQPYRTLATKPRRFFAIFVSTRRRRGGDANPSILRVSDANRRRNQEESGRVNSVWCREWVREGVCVCVKMKKMKRWGGEAAASHLYHTHTPLNSLILHPYTTLLTPT